MNVYTSIQPSDTQTPTHRTQTSNEVFMKTKLLKILKILLYDSVSIADVDGFVAERL